MAHKGKKYKLQFRRDLTLNRLQTLGAGECYELNVRVQRSAPPFTPLLFSALAVNLDKSAAVDRVWETDYVIVLSRRWKIRCTQIRFFEYPNSKQRWEIIDQVQGLIYKIEGGQQTSDSNYGAWGCDDRGTPTFWKPPFPADHQQTVLNAVLQGYATYNP